MIEPVGAIGVRPETTATDFQALANNPGLVDPATAESFEVMVSGDNLRVAQAGDALPPATVTDVTAGNQWVVQPGPAEAIPKPTFIESISGELQDIRQGWLDVRADMQSAFESDPTILDVMRLQMDLQHSTNMTQLLVNTVSAFNQEIGKLMRAS
ncbi:MAG: hypothetical protein GY935_02160 [Gammaproteobacteria bacterium]|nr:hypothetical protein [Gammaproteobacteria bacterium]